jgi:hypothetical protein
LNMQFAQNTPNGAHRKYLVGRCHVLFPLQVPAKHAISRPARQDALSGLIAR